MTPTSDPFATSLAFVWKFQYDSPGQGYHCDPRDPGAGTKGGVIEKTWQDCVARGIVSGSLRTATNDQLAAVLRFKCWGKECAQLPGSTGFLLFNGRMMTGHYTWILQGCLGVPEDGSFGPKTMSAAQAADPAKLNDMLLPAHLKYLKMLPVWQFYGHGWTTRLVDAHTTAASIIKPQTMSPKAVATKAVPQPASAGASVADHLDDLYNHL